MTDLVQLVELTAGDDDATSETASAPAAKRRPGRPKGSKNKTKKAAKAGAKRRPGRPKGSKNKPKAESAKRGAKKKRKPGRPKGSKNKPKATAAPVKKAGRRGRRPSPVTGEKMAYVGAMLSKDATLSMNAIKPMIIDKFGSMLAHDKLKEAYEAWMRANGRPIKSNGRRSAASRRGVGRRASDVAAAHTFTTLGKLPQFFVAVRQPERNDISVTAFASEREANTYIHRLVVDNGVSLNAIGFYASFQPMIDINIDLRPRG